MLLRYKGRVQAALVYAVADAARGRSRWRCPSIPVRGPTGPGNVPLTLAVSPSGPVISAQDITPGMALSGRVTVTNLLSLAQTYQNSAPWSPGGATSLGAAARLATERVVSVAAGYPGPGGDTVVCRLPGRPGQPAAGGAARRAPRHPVRRCERHPARGRRVWLPGMGFEFGPQFFRRPAPAVGQDV
ncbi:protein of unknown function [Candidatus Hydrogenisulfobacillus filiaventi]|uniref:Uncharacterized protein n=1 Tax=Candidatus Hydrogenisulfobacillus filiaventi TaxID=2707344 RepID=A0A6F8ZGW3_9FIRM|nr:protein of unknown function [Candidatus Hydrogenisulfobacillus filiaventi]